MYQNEFYSNKWYYSFITNMEYINDNLTYVYITTDVFQTWQFDIIYKQSFIEREMINTNEDTPGANLLPEGLETGEYKVSGTAEIDELECWYVVAYAEANYGYKLNGIYSGIKYLVYSDAELLRSALFNIDEAHKSNLIVTIFTVPKLAFSPLNQINGEIENDIKGTPKISTLISTPSNLDGYTPRNQKLRTYPFLYVGFNPNGGNSKIYRYEDFTNGTPIFKFISEINPNPQVAVIPQNYRGNQGDSLQDIGFITGYPTISYSSDVFNVWLAQNSNIVKLQTQQQGVELTRNVAQNIVKGNSNVVNDMSNGNYVNAGINALNNITTNQWNNQTNLINYDFYIRNQMAQIEKQQMLPDEANFGSNNTTLLGYDLFDKNIFTRYTIKRQFAERIDKFFDMYGYLTNQVKLPNINNRPNWNYVKTIGINLLGNIPQNDLQLIKDMFDNGITLWHNPSTFLDYSQNNR